MLANVGRQMSTSFPSSCSPITCMRAYARPPNEQCFLTSKLFPSPLFSICRLLSQPFKRYNNFFKLSLYFIWPIEYRISEILRSVLDQTIVIKTVIIFIKLKNKYQSIEQKNNTIWMGFEIELVLGSKKISTILTASFFLHVFKWVFLIGLIKSQFVH